ncbi:GHMP kinase [Blyttiomyces helicus]|uniref:Homoserine kinase n=1 Tax=Blyttiomyces helicus TaxID=388810 RepID=A0A4P9W9R1_9FUNG|nr:GHMP kinase [Blyttiomyces helicus]|eukprot:RKO89301.1 GHMP kinase [Blyttiomyces helicus]
MPKKFLIRVPASTANLGPGFDALGAALSLHLVLTATLTPKVATTITYTGPTPCSTVPLHPFLNMITRTAIYLATAHNTTLPRMALHIANPIPLGRGLGSSGAAVVGGLVLANLACGLGLDKARLLDHCIAFEGHPDNVAASLFGGAVAGLMVRDVRQVHVDLCKWESDVEELAAADAEGAGPVPPVPALEAGPIGLHVRVPVSEAIRCVVVVPRFELSTKLARSVLPETYSRPDVVFNLSRTAVLVAALGAATPNPVIIREAMRDRVHQYYRRSLVPGMSDVLEMADVEGLLGVCVSGSGPTAIAFATAGFEEIGAKMRTIFGKAVGADGEGSTAGGSRQDP